MAGNWDESIVQVSAGEEKIVPENPPVPLTLEGASMLHQMYRMNWKAWRGLSEAERMRIGAAAVAGLKKLAEPQHKGDATVLYSMLGHKGDLMFLHLRHSVEELNRVELALAQMEFFDFLDLRHSYLSVVELGLYESSAKTYSALTAQGVAPFTPEWTKSIEETRARQAHAMAARLYPAIPETKYVCFYPMDRRRGEELNWYCETMADRQRMMHEHGMIGRRYADEVKQIISGSIGLDDWEWGVDLFAQDPVVFKKLIYEMRFDEVSAKYGLFGAFFVGVHLPLEKLGNWLGGTL